MGDHREPIPPHPNLFEQIPFNKKKRWLAIDFNYLLARAPAAAAGDGRPSGANPSEANQSTFLRITFAYSAIKNINLTNSEKGIIFAIQTKK